MWLHVDGAPVFAATGGTGFDPARPAVVMVHGAGMDHSVWALQARYLAHHGRGVLAVDLPGHGRSGGPALTSPQAMADWLVRLLDAAGVAQAAVVGHSMGALAALEAAARHAGRWRALALVGAAARMPVHPDLLHAAEADDPAAVEMILAWGHGARTQVAGGTAPGVWTVGLARRLLLAARPGVLHADLAACDGYRNGLEAAAAVRCPALLVLAGEDRMTPAKAGRKLAQAIAEARVVELPRCGHMAMTEAPDAALDALAGAV